MILTGLTPRARLHSSGFRSESLHDVHLKYIAERLVKRFLFWFYIIILPLQGLVMWAGLFPRALP